MSKFKRHIKNVFSIAGIEWRDGKKTGRETGILLSKLNNKTSSDRSQIADEQYFVNVEDFVKNTLDKFLLDIEYKPQWPDQLVDKDVGNILAGTPVDDLAGLEYSELFDRIFFVDPPEYFPGEDYITINSPVSEVEIGESISFDATAQLVRGFITSQNGAPPQFGRGPAILFTFEDQTGVTPIVAVTDGQIYLGTPYSATPGINSLSCLIEWADGTGSYYDQVGNESHAWDPQRVAGSNSVLGVVTAYYKAFYGSGVIASAPIDSLGVRALVGSVFLTEADNSGTFSFVIPAGDVQAYFYVPEGKTVKVFHGEESSIYLTKAFNVAPIVVNDGGGVPVNYEAWVLDIGGVGYLYDATIIVGVNEPV